MSKKNKKLLVYLFIVFASFLLLFINKSVYSPLKNLVVQGTALPIRIISYPFREIKKILYYHRTYEEYLRQKKEVNSLKARIIAFDEVILENSRLEKLLEFKRKLVFSSVAANVIGRDPSNWNATIIIDKGKVDGIAPGMPVVNALGVVGKIAEVSGIKSKVILISDPAFSVASIAHRSREIGLVSGTLGGLCRMRYLSEGADIREGDQITTSKLSSHFPEGLMIGEVVSVRRSKKSPTIDCVIQPAVTLSQIEEVLVIQKP